MNWQEHVEQAELLLKECEQDLPVVQTQRDIQVIDIQVQMAQAHALIAEQKRALS